MRPTALHLAWRSICANRLTAFFLIGAVAAGVGLQIPNTANLDGYRAELVQHGIEAGFGDVRVRAADASYLHDGRDRAATWRADPRVRDAGVALTFPGALGVRGRFQGAPVFGVDMARTDRPFRLLKGLILPPGDQGGVIVGTALAERLGVALGDEVELRVIYATASDTDARPDARDGAKKTDLGRYTMTVRGLAVGTFGASQAVFVDYQFIAEEAALDGATSLVTLYLHEHGQAPAVIADLKARNPDIEAADWMTDDPFIRSAIQAITVISAVSEAMVICAVAIPVLALLFIHVTHRRRDVGVLAAVGFSPHDVFFLFAWHAAIVGVIGVILGCGLGYGVIRYFQLHPIFSWQGFVVEPVVSVGGFARPALIIFAVVMSAGVLPAWRAARVDPARVLRGGP